MLKVMSILGTRPEAIKMAPVIKELSKYPQQIDSCVVATAQHRQMLDQVLSIFDIEPNIDLNLMETGQELSTLMAKAVTSMTNVIKKQSPHLVLVQGDTTTAMISALASFHERVPVGHVEAGLRTNSRYSPFPEEINRRVISVLGTYHFAPTQRAVSALLAEGIQQKDVYLTGNTVVDALKYMLGRPPMSKEELLHAIGLKADKMLNRKQKLILVTGHRRENFGKPLENICVALKEISEHNPHVEIVYPVHLNPNVQQKVYEILSNVERVHLIPPLEYRTFVQLMSHSYLILTDSGGIQEEAPSVGKPVLVMRDTTERSEALDAGGARLVGTEVDSIVKNVTKLLQDEQEYSKMSNAVNPFGDGMAAEKIVSILRCCYNIGDRPL